MTHAAKAFFRGFGKSIDLFGITRVRHRPEAGLLAQSTGLPIHQCELYLDWLRIGDDFRGGISEWRRQHGESESGRAS